MEFVIPLQRDDLRNVGVIGQYVVEKVSNVNDIASGVKGCSQSLSSTGPGFILKNFDILYSCLCKFNHLKPSIRSDVWNLMLKAIGSLVSDVGLLLDDETDTIDDDTRGRAVNVLKMNSYIICQLAMLFEDEDKKATSDVIVPTGKGRAKSKNKQTVNWDWTLEKIRAISLMRELCRLPLCQLWSPPFIEEEFLNLVCNCCYKLLENLSLNRTKELKEAIFDLLGNVLKLYKNTISVAVKIIQLLQQYEHLAVPLGQATVIFIKKYNIKSLLSQIIREIGTMDAKDFAVEGQAIRSFTAFLIEITQQLPAIVVSNIAILATHLDQDPYGMRNCVLSIMGEILLKTCPSKVSDDGKEPPEMDDRARLLRDQFLDHLEAHVHDVHAFVRSRSLTIWTSLFTETAVPLDRYQPVLELTVGRLEDKSSLVRKNAIILLTAILRANPFGANFSINTLTQQLNKEIDKIKAMCVSDSSSHMDESPSGIQSKSDRWAKKEAAIKECLEKMVAEKKCNRLNHNPTLEQVIAVQTLLDAGRYQQALSVLFEAPNEQDLPGNEKEIESRVQDYDDDEDNSSSTSASSASNSLLSISGFLKSFRSIYIAEAAPVAVKLVVADEDHSGEQGKSNSANVSAHKMIIEYLKDCIKFVKVVNKAMPVLCQLLSGQQTDIVMAIEFFVLANEFGMQEAIMGVRKMLPLVWSKEPIIKEAVVSAFKRIYIDSYDCRDIARDEAIANTFINLIKEAGDGQRAAMEELICEFVRTNVLPDDICKCMWIRFANRSREFSIEDGNAAIVFLGMAAGADKTIIESNLQLLVSVGLGDRAKGNFQLSKDVCIALLKLNDTAKPTIGAKKSPPRLPPNHIIFLRLAEILVDGVNRTQDEMYIPMAEQMVTVVYKLAEHPDTICEHILVQISTNMITSMESQPSQSAARLIFSPPVVLARFISLCGQVALCQMTHLEVNIFTELKRRRHIAEESDKNKAKNKKSNKRHSLSASAVRAPKAKNRDQLESIDDDCEMTGATADDEDAECIGKVCDKRLVTGNNLLARMAPMIVTIASNPGQFPNRKLQTAACLALAKYMMVSSDFCNDKMQLLITILEKSEHPIIRANIILSLGDLCCRFPNAVEPWTPHIYAKLSDQIYEVRRNAILVLTHLILHDMIKVKGHISHLALCAVDEDERIADQAKLLFRELSQKANAIFNLMPEIVTRLSDVTVGTTEKKFQAVMKYILPFVQKDRLVESLVEKLLQRFPLASTERQWRDLAFCMPELCRNSKCYLIILENISLIADKLHEETVYKHFSDVISNAKKTIKPESKTMIEELEEKINTYHLKGVDDEAAFATASQATQRRGIANKNAKGKRKTPRRTNALCDDDDFRDGTVERTSRQTKQSERRPIRAVGQRKRITVTFSSDSDGDMVAPARKSPNSPKVILSEDTSGSDY